MAENGLTQSATPVSAPPVHPPSQFQLPDDSDAPMALVRSVRMIAGQDGAAIEIMATRPLTPGISTVENPLRLVVDLPKSLIASRMRISYRDPQVQGVRVDQFNQNPPTVRIVVNLSTAASASWDAAGNRLMVRLHPPQTAAVQVDAAEGSVDAGPTDGGIPVGAGLVLSGGTAAGSSVSAGAGTAVLHIAKRGEVHVCPGTTVSVTTAQSGGGIMLGMSTGSLETHYRLDGAGDSVLTPDFRIVFAGQGESRYAISADSRGDTCVRGLPGNMASALVSELMGDGLYQVKPSEEVVFRSGQLKKVDSRVPEDCGCPVASTPVLRAGAGENASPGISAADAPPANAAARVKVEPGSETAELPESLPNDVHIQVDAPFVFRAPATKTTLGEAANLPLVGAQPRENLPLTVLPPDGKAGPGSAAAGSHKGFLGRIRGFFGEIFR